MTYTELKEQIKQNFVWYAYTENIPNDEKIITDFLCYWFNDGKECMSYNLTSMDMYNPKHREYTSKLSKKKWEKLENETYIDFIEKCECAIRFIYKNINELINYGFINKNGFSIFGVKIWENPLFLKEKIKNFAVLEKITL